MSDPVMIDGLARNFLVALCNLRGEDSLRTLLLQWRREDAAEIRRERLVAWKTKTSRLFVRKAKPDGAADPYAGMAKPLRGPAIPVAEIRERPLGPVIWTPKEAWPPIYGEVPAEKAEQKTSNIKLLRPKK
jgi:hypothetical protein